MITFKHRSLPLGNPFRILSYAAFVYCCSCRAFLPLCRNAWFGMGQYILFLCMRMNSKLQLFLLPLCLLESVGARRSLCRGPAFFLLCQGVFGARIVSVSQPDILQRSLCRAPAVSSIRVPPAPAPIRVPSGIAGAPSSDPCAAPRQPQAPSSDPPTPSSHPRATACGAPSSTAAQLQSTCHPSGPRALSSHPRATHPARCVPFSRERTPNLTVWGMINK